VTFQPTSTSQQQPSSLLLSTNGRKQFPCNYSPASPSPLSQSTLATPSPSSFLSQRSSLESEKLNLVSATTALKVLEEVSEAINRQIAEARNATINILTKLAAGEAISEEEQEKFHRGVQHIEYLKAEIVDRWNISSRPKMPPSGGENTSPSNASLSTSTQSSIPISSVVNTPSNLMNISDVEEKAQKHPVITRNFVETGSGFFAKNFPVSPVAACCQQGAEGLENVFYFFDKETAMRAFVEFRQGKSKSLSPTPSLAHSKSPVAAFYPSTGGVFWFFTEGAVVKAVQSIMSGCSSSRARGELQSPTNPPKREEAKSLSQ